MQARGFSTWWGPRAVHYNAMRLPSTISGYLVVKFGASEPSTRGQYMALQREALAEQNNTSNSWTISWQPYHPKGSSSHCHCQSEYRRLACNHPFDYYKSNYLFCYLQNSVRGKDTPIPDVFYNSVSDRVWLIFWKTILRSPFILL